GNTCPSSPGDPNGYASVIELFAADLVLEDGTPPTVGGVAGGLAQAGTVSGQSDVAFEAGDGGSGAYEARFSVDGSVVQSTVLDSNGGHCHDVGETGDGRPAFLYAQPCEGKVKVDVPFATTGVGDGTHHLLVSVLDAAGNAMTALDREVVFANGSRPGGGGSQPGGAGAPQPRGPANGTNASEAASLTAGWRGTRRARVSCAYGHARTIEGTLTASNGQGIAGALIEVTQTPAYLGAHATGLPGVRTDARGRWTLRLPRGISSGELDFAYRSHVGDARPAATRTLQLSVRAGLALAITPRVSGAGQTIHFSGRLLGGPIPPGGKQIVLEARSPGSAWIEFRVLRTDGRGRFHSSYRFRYPGPVHYAFRAVSRSEADYPFAAGASRSVGVFER
ncbi:MAG TPA: carboxypeptidase-like regulatory domain-containing protein, partial [Solirubrobacteraceae bacterium]|nr:carboxypeptidase-like regulatory domain-containing protein [Solirubrobacteraceae bacterium]